MLSWRLWQALIEPAYKNPIFKRSCNERRLQATAKTSATFPKFASRLIVLLIGLAIINTPYLLLLFFQIPAFVIMIVVLTPLFLPLIIMVFGIYLVSKITMTIHKEKRQYTYDLLCASPDGTLRANWIFATGIVHRGDWFYWIEALGHFTYRIGQIFLLGTASFTLISLLRSDPSTHFEILRTLINILLLVGLYYTNMMQSFVQILLVGLYATSLDLNQRDSNLIGLVTYIIIQIMPYLIATFLFVVLHRVLPNPHPALAIGLDFIILSSIYIVQEFNINILWYQLTKRWNSTSSSYIVGRVAPFHI
jgi:hypothetical protein